MFSVPPKIPSSIRKILLLIFVCFSLVTSQEANAGIVGTCSRHVIAWLFGTTTPEILKAKRGPEQLKEEREKMEMALWESRHVRVAINEVLVIKPALENNPVTRRVLLEMALRMDFGPDQVENFRMIEQNLRLHDKVESRERTENLEDLALFVRAMEDHMLKPTDKFSPLDQRLKLAKEALIVLKAYVKSKKVAIDFRKDLVRPPEPKTGEQTEITRVLDEVLKDNLTYAEGYMTIGYPQGVISVFSGCRRPVMEDALRGRTTHTDSSGIATEVDLKGKVLAGDFSAAITFFKDKLGFQITGYEAYTTFEVGIARTTEELARQVSAKPYEHQEAVVRALECHLDYLTKMRDYLKREKYVPIEMVQKVELPKVEIPKQVPREIWGKLEIAEATGEKNADVEKQRSYHASELDKLHFRILEVLEQAEKKVPRENQSKLTGRRDLLMAPILRKGGDHSQKLLGELMKSEGKRDDSRLDGNEVVTLVDAVLGEVKKRQLENVKLSDLDKRKNITAEKNLQVALGEYAKHLESVKTNLLAMGFKPVGVEAKPEKASPLELSSFALLRDRIRESTWADLGDSARDLNASRRALIDRLIRFGLSTNDTLVAPDQIKVFVDKVIGTKEIQPSEVALLAKTAREQIHEFLNEADGLNKEGVRLKDGVPKELTDDLVFFKVPMSGYIGQLKQYMYYWQHVERALVAGKAVPVPVPAPR